MPTYKVRILKQGNTTTYTVNTTTLATVTYRPEDGKYDITTHDSRETADTEPEAHTIARESIATLFEHLGIAPEYLEEDSDRTKKPAPELLNRANRLNRLYDFHLTVYTCCGKNTIASDNRCEILLTGTESECMSYLAGIERAAQILAARHGLTYEEK